jgi:hypothetical protein
MNGSDRATQIALNFALSGNHDNVWSNENAEIIDQHLDRRMVEVRDARLGPPTSLRDEGFVIAKEPLLDAKWNDSLWIQDAYLPNCQALVERLTGAELVLPYSGVLVRMAEAEERERLNAAPPARFVHIDQTPESAEQFVNSVAAGIDRSRFKRVVIYNVWRSISPPPQNTPLALCDKRTVKREMLMTGRTVSARFPEGVPYVSSLFSPDYRWHYFPDVEPEEVIVFKSVDVAGRAEIGCLHSAFDVPEPVPGARPRCSAEARVLAFFTW